MRYNTAMTITLKAETEAYLEQRVAAGDFASVDEAAEALIENQRLDDEDLSWVEPYLAPAFESLDNGGGIPSDEAWAKVYAHIEARRS